MSQYGWSPRYQSASRACHLLSASPSARAGAPFTCSCTQRTMALRKICPAIGKSMPGAIGAVVAIALSAAGFVRAAAQAT